jgi:hypothetical protein
MVSEDFGVCCGDSARCLGILIPDGYVVFIQVFAQEASHDLPFV